MSNVMYHAYLPQNHEYHVSMEEVMNDGIKHSTVSNNRYSIGGKVKFDITETLRPSHTPNWLDFKEAIGVDMRNRFSTSFCFPVFTDKIRVFNGDISLAIYDQAFYEDLKDFDEEALNFDTGENIEHWIKLYWGSMVTLEEYLREHPYPNPEVLIFTSVPKGIIQVCEE
ncbi:DNA polymerase III [Lysinibacillus sp. 3P01SB]|uniref:DNA polymerase III n=1 Tax=Lysinibacillus sp. 3P01SB TaxID=3132284 RepID=UPI0039A5289F